MDKPEADLIEGLPPAVAIQQRTATKNPRSTVATVTEAYDYLRVLFARIGTIHCLQCGRPVARDTIDDMAETLLKEAPGARVTVSFPWPAEKGLAPLKKLGFYRLIRDGGVISFEGASFAKAETLAVFVDRTALDPDDRDRLVDSLELGLKHGGGRVRVEAEDGRVWPFSDKLECKACGIPYEDPFPNLFSFNSPQGACPAPTATASVTWR